MFLISLSHLCNHFNFFHCKTEMFVLLKILIEDILSLSLLLRQLLDVSERLLKFQFLQSFWEFPLFKITFSPSEAHIVSKFSF